MADFTVLHPLGSDWMLMQSSVAGATFANEFALLAPPSQQFHKLHLLQIYSIDYTFRRVMMHYYEVGILNTMPGNTQAR